MTSVHTKHVRPLPPTAGRTSNSVRGPRSANTPATDPNVGISAVSPAEDRHIDGDAKTNTEEHRRGLSDPPMFTQPLDKTRIPPPPVPSKENRGDLRKFSSTSSLPRKGEGPGGRMNTSTGSTGSTNSDDSEWSADGDDDMNDEEAEEEDGRKARLAKSTAGGPRRPPPMVGSQAAISRQDRSGTRYYVSPSKAHKQKQQAKKTGQTQALPPHQQRSQQQQRPSLPHSTSVSGTSSRTPPLNMSGNNDMRSTAALALSPRGSPSTTSRPHSSFNPRTSSSTTTFPSFTAPILSTTTATPSSSSSVPVSSLAFSRAISPPLPPQPAKANDDDEPFPGIPLSSRKSGRGGLLSKNQKGSIADIRQFKKNRRRGRDVHSRCDNESLAAVGILQEWNKVSTYESQSVDAIYQSVVSRMLRAMRVDGEAAHSMTVALSCHHKPIPRIMEKDQKDILTSIVRDIQTMLDAEKEMCDLIRIQARVRGHQQRKRYALLTKNYSADKQVVNKVFLRMVRKSDQYVSNLDIITQRYLKPLRSRGIISVFEIKNLFSNVEVLLELEKEFQRELHLLHQKWPVIEGVGEVVLRMAPFFKAYLTYVNNFGWSQHTLVKLCDEQPEFAAFIDEADTEEYELAQLLPKPLNHLREMEVNLEEMVPHIAQDHPDYRSVSDAHSVISETSTFLRRSLEQGKLESELMTVQEKLILPDDVQLELRDGKRSIISDSEVEVSSVGKSKLKGGQGHLLLFNDICLVTRTTPKSGWELVFFCPMEHLKVEPRPDQPLQVELARGERKDESKSLRGTTVLDLMTIIEAHLDALNRPLAVTFQTKGTRESTVVELSRLRLLNKRGVFGVPLEVLLEREGRTERGVPLLVEDIITYLRNVALNTEGLFRISGNAGKINEHIKNCNTGKPPPAKHMPIHEAAGLLKQYFRDLPNPVLTFDLYEPLLKSYHLHDKGDLEIGPLVNQLRVHFKRLLRPGVYRSLTLYLMAFLGEVIANSEHNKMNAQNMAVVFGPNILKPRVDSIDNTLNVPKANAVIAILLENAETVFPTLKDAK